MAIVDDMFEIRKNSNSYILCFMTNVPTLNFPFSGKTQLVLGVQKEKSQEYIQLIIFIGILYQYISGSKSRQFLSIHEFLIILILVIT
jgi:hypothetical protein